MRHWSLALAFVGMLFAGVCGGAREGEKAEIDKKASQALADMGAHLGGLKGFSVEIEETVDRVKDGTKEQVTSIHAIDFSRPAGLRRVTTGDAGERSLTVDGKNAWLVDHGRKEAVVGPAVGDVPTVLAALYKGWRVSLPEAEVFAARPETALTRKVQSGRYVGLRLADGERCHLLAFTQPVLDWQMWIGGEKPWPRKLVISGKKQPNSPQTQLILRKWMPRDTFPEGHFTGAVPGGFRMIPLTSSEKK